MSHFTYRKLLRSTCLIAALAVGFQTTAAMAQSEEAALINTRINYLGSISPGSAIVYAGCRAAADSSYKSDKSIGNALAVIATCDAIGCGFTDDYKNCGAVVTELFLLDLRLEAIS